MKKLYAIALIAVVLNLSTTPAAAAGNAYLFNLNRRNISVNNDLGADGYSGTNLVWKLKNFGGKIIIDVYGASEVNSTFLLLYRGPPRIFRCLAGEGKYMEYRIIIKPTPPRIDPMIELIKPFYRYYFSTPSPN